MRWIVPVVLLVTGVAHAGNDAPAENARWEARLGAGIGAARTVMLGDTHGALAVTIDLDALRWNGDVGLGLYVSELITNPWHEVKSANDRPTFRELPVEIEPQFGVRGMRRLTPMLTTGWLVNASAGVVFAKTSEECARYSNRSCLNTLESSVEVGASAGAGVFAHVGPVAFDVGVRAQGDSAGDAAIALQGSAGATW